MNAYLLALCWALPMLGLAVLNIYGLVSDDAMKVMLAITPALAVVSINNARCCANSEAVD
jgi:hypothetical protein